jgi:hypothetical protein
LSGALAKILQQQKQPALKLNIVLTNHGHHEHTKHQRPLACPLPPFISPLIRGG